MRCCRCGGEGCELCPSLVAAAGPVACTSSGPPPASDAWKHASTISGVIWALIIFASCIAFLKFAAFKAHAWCPCHAKLTSAGPQAYMNTAVSAPMCLCSTATVAAQSAGSGKWYGLPGSTCAKRLTSSSSSHAAGRVAAGPPSASRVNGREVAAGLPGQGRVKAAAELKKASSRVSPVAGPFLRPRTCLAPHRR
jgi:hypothetical protein